MPAITDQPKILDCENEPLANSGLIQPGGALLFLDKRSRQFSYATANAEQLLGEPAQTLLGQDGGDWLTGVLPDLGPLPTAAGQRLQLPAAVDLGAGLLDVLISPTSSGWLLEFEPSISDAEVADSAAPGLAAAPMHGEGLDALEQQLVDQVRDLTGFERVMLYQFHPDWTGEVVAESTAPGAATYFGLRFPASDIPAIARALYAQTPYRHVPDITALAVAIQSRAGESTALDLTWSDLRSVSPVHVQYLKNMNVASSFSVSVMVDGQLWGLVACHHGEPRSIPLARRNACRGLADQFVERLGIHRRSIQQDIHQALSHSLAQMRAAAAAGGTLSTAVAAGFDSLAKLFNAAAGAVWVDRELTALGTGLGAALDCDTLDTLHNWCLRQQSQPIMAFEQLPAQLTAALPDAAAAIGGFLSISLRAHRHDDALVQLYLLRAEEISEIAWAGNPEKPLEPSADGLRLSPRDSFDKWVEVRRGFCKPWNDHDRFAAEQLRERLMSWI